MNRALLLAAALLPLIGASPAFGQTPPVPANTPDVTRLNQLESEYADVMNEAGQLGSGRTIDESIRFSTNRQGQLRVDLQRLEEGIQRQGGTIEELDAARQRFENETVFGLREGGEEVAEEAATHAVTQGFSLVFRRVLGVATLVGDVITYGGRKIIKELNVSDMEALVRQGRLQLSDMYDFYSVMNAELVAEIRAQQRLRELQPRQRALFEQIAEERARLNLLGVPATSRAVLNRDPDAAGDAALQREADREALDRGVRLSNPAEDARRQEELRRGGRGVTPAGVSMAPGFGGEAAGMTAVVHIGWGELEAPTQAGTGFQRTGGGPESFAGRNADAIRMRTLGLVLFPLAYREWLISGSVLHGDGDERSEGRVPDGTGIDTGFVYGDFSPGGSTGVNIADRGLNWIANTEAEMLNLKLKAVHAATGPVTWFLFADYLNSRRQYDSAAMAEVFGETLTQMRSQRLTDDLVGAGAGVQFDQRAGGVYVGGWTSAGLFHRSSELRASERNVCPLCGPQDADFTLNFDDKDDGATWALAAGVWLAIPVTPSVSVGIGVDAAYFDEVGAVFNPSSGDQVFVDGLTTRLTTTDAFDYNFRIGARLRF